MQRILFAKGQGTNLSLKDWQAQSAGEDGVEERTDALAVAGKYLWEAISQRGLAFAQASRQMESIVIKTALKVGGSTRREVAKRLRTSERTLYRKMRQHHLESYINM